MNSFGPFCFGLVIGWVTYRTLRRKADGVALGDIAAVIGSVGGATVVALFKSDAFDGYCIGLAVGFFAYFLTGIAIDRWWTSARGTGGGAGGAGGAGGPQAGTGPGSWMETRDSQ